MADVRAVLFDFGSTLFAHGSLADSIETAIGLLDNSRSREWASDLAERIDGAAHTADELQHPRDLDTDVWRERWHVLYALADDEVPGLGAAIYAVMHDPVEWTPYATTSQTLTRLHAAGIPLAIVSNTGWDIRSVFVAHRLVSLVDSFVLSFEVGAVKPDAQIFEAACDSLGVPPTECLMVGDDARADSGGTAIGMRVLLVPPMSPGVDNGVEAAARIVLRND